MGTSVRSYIASQRDKVKASGYGKWYWPNPWWGKALMILAYLLIVYLLLWVIIPMIFGAILTRGAVKMKKAETKAEVKEDRQDRKDTKLAGDMLKKAFKQCRAACRDQFKLFQIKKRRNCIAACRSKYSAQLQQLGINVSEVEAEDGGNE